MFDASIARDHPVLNAVLMVVVFVVVTGGIVFAKPLDRLVDRINLKALQALGIVDRDPAPPEDADNEPDAR